MSDDRCFTNRQMFVNLIANMTAFAVKALQGVLFTPFLVRYLGIELFGLIALAVSLTGFLGLVSTAVTSGLARFITIDIEKNDFAAANAFFNTALAVVLTASGPLLLAAALIGRNAGHLIPLAAASEDEAGMLLLGVIVAFVVSMVGGIFGSVAYARNRLDIVNLLEVSNIAVRVGPIVLLFVLAKASLGVVGAAYIAGALVSGALAILFWRRLTPFLSLSYRALSGAALSRLLRFGGWITVDQAGTLLLLNCELIIISRLWGMAAAGEYALVLQWSALLWAIAAVFANLLTPTVYSQYAREDLPAIIATARKAVRSMGLVMALPTGLICGFAASLLSLWAGREYSGLAPLLWLAAGHLALNLAVLPLFAVNRAFNALRLPALATVLAGAGSICLMVLLSRYTDWGLFAIPLAGATMLSARNLLFLPWYTGRLTGVPAGIFGRELVPGLLGTLFVTAAAIATDRLGFATGLTELAVGAGIVSIVYGALVWGVIHKNGGLGRQAATVGGAIWSRL